MTESESLVQITNLTKHFPIFKGLFQRQVAAVHAVDGISFNIERGETFGLVGESGCGKSTAGRTILRLYEPTSGTIQFDGVNISRLSPVDMRKFRRRMQMIFQDPYASLNPRMTVREIIAEPAVAHHLMSWKEANEMAGEMLETVQLNRHFAPRFPHEFSGGQRQRIGIARVLSLRPDFIICDEPISALDVSVQAQIVNLLKQLQAKFELTYLFIAHDLAMVRHISKRVGVMYLGVLAELADCDEIYSHPLHPYTQALLSAIPIPDAAIERQRSRIILKGDVPSPVNPPSGCRFRTRCPLAKTICAEERPAWREVASRHWVACHLV
jgi:oligopeptide transport system ATP-binding protein